MVNKDLCIGCGACESAWPVGAIQIIDGKSHINNNICIKCGTCESICPVQAIKIERENNHAPKNEQKKSASKKEGEESNFDW